MTEGPSAQTHDGGSDRHVSPLTGAYNFRDLGGLRTAAGRPLRPGVLFRSDTLQALTDEDVTRLVEQLGVELVVDLRIGPEAVSEGRGPLVTASVCYVNAPLRDLPLSDLPPAQQSLHFYLEHLASPSPVLPMIVRLLAAAAGRPAVLHCAAGKDRTGLVTALVLRLVGVTDDDIVADYLATGHNMARIRERFRTWARYRDHMDVVPEQVYEAHQSTIRGFLVALDTQYGGAAGWAARRGVPDAVVADLAAGLLDPPGGASGPGEGHPAQRES